MERVERKGRRRLHLKEATQPGVGDVDILVELLAAGDRWRLLLLLAETQPRRTVGSQLLNRLKECLAEVNVGGAVGRRAGEVEGLPVDAETGVGALVLAED